MRLSAAEGQRRHEAIRDWSTKNGYAGYVIFNSENFIYATNFLLDVATWERPVAAIFPANGEPILQMNELSINHYDVSLERNSVWVRDAAFYIEHPRVVGRSYTRPEWDRMLADLLVKSGMGKGRIAVDSMGPVSAALRSYLPDATFHSAPELIRDLRLIKSEDELNILRTGGKITNWGMAQLKSIIAPGEYIWELGFETEKRVARYLAEPYPEEAFAINVHADTGVDTACPHSPGGNAGRKISKGDSIICNVILRINGLIIEDERTFIVGAPSEDQVHYMDAMTRAQQAAIDAMVEGNIVADIDSAAQQVHEEAGTSQFLFHRTGHGIGIGGHEYPDDTAYNYRPLKYGMVFSAEPAVFVRGLGGFRHSDTVIVGKEKPETVTNFSKKLEDLIVSA